MNVSEATEERLFRYHDGDLSASEDSEVRRLLERDPEAQRLLRRTERLGEVLREALGAADEEALGEVPSEAMFRRIEERLGERGLEGDAADRSSEAAPPTRPSRLRVVPGGRSRWVAAGVGAAVFAAAAAAVLVLWPARDAAHPGAPPLAHRVVPAAGSEVEEVDFGENAGTVFEVRGEAGQPLAVVWIEEEGEGQ